MTRIGDVLGPEAKREFVVRNLVPGQVLCLQVRLPNGTRYKFARFTVDHKCQAIGAAFAHENEIFISCPVGKPDLET